MDSVKPVQQVSQQMTIAFIVCLVIGIALIKVSPFAPCAPLITYAGIGFFLTREQRNSDRFADSLYYMGFLLTLSALLLALLGLSDNPDPLAVAKALGAGLSASIVGLGLRVLIVQFRGTVADQEEEAQISIEEQAEKVRGALRSLETEWTEAGAVLKIIRVDLEEFRDSLKAVHANTLVTAQTRHKQLLDSTARAAKAWEDEIDRIRKSLANIEIPPTLAKEQFDKIARQVGSDAAGVVTAGAKAMESATKSLAKVGQASEVSVQKLEQLGNALQDTLGAAASIQQAARVLAATLVEAGREAKGGMSGLGEGSQRLGLVISAVSTSLQGLESSAKKASHTVHVVASNVDVLSDALVKDIKGVAADLDTVRTATAELVDLARNELAKTA